MNINLMGDPHLGRVFQHGVPLARRGEREEMMWAQFAKELEAVNNLDCDLHVNMGDLFDKAIVSYDTIVRAAAIYDRVALARPNVTFVILKGNHDLLRDLERKSAFDVFVGLIKAKNIVCVTNPVLIKGRLFVGYHPTIRAEDLLTDDFKGADAYYGHNDITDYGNDHNVLPTRRLAELGILTAYTGHIHKPSVFDRNGVNVTVVGSMQPYAHGEQINDDLYVTLGLDEIEAAGDLTNKCVRIRLKEGEVLEDEINCLQLIVERAAGVNDSAPIMTVGSFDMEKLFREAFLNAGVSADTTETMVERYNDRRLHSDAE